MCVVMCESAESVMFDLSGDFVITCIIYAMFIFDIISVPSYFLDIDCQS
jgi:hypothetical protein